MTFHARLTLAATVAVAAAIVLGSIGVWFLVRSELRGQVDHSLEQLAGRVDVLDGKGRPALSLPPRELGEPAGAADLVVPREGKRSRDLLLPVPPEARDVAEGTHPDFFRDDHFAGLHVRVLTTRKAPGVAVQLLRPLEEVDAVLRRLAILLASMGAGGIVLAGLLGWGVARASLKPVRRMTGVTETVTETGDLAARIHVPGRGRDELGRLAASFNRMMDALEASIRTQRQLLADASHELRTPLTSLRTNIEVLASAERLSEGDRDRLMADVGEQLEELSHLVADILELARDGEAPKVEDVALDDLVRRAVDRVRSRAPHLTFATDLHPSVVVGVPGRLDRAVSNLLDNAAKWSPPGAPVEVSVADGAVVVRDHGPGIAEDDLPRVFDRFYRAPAARAMPGSGLGLAIVRQIAESHGGTVSAATAPDGGTVLRLELLAAS